MDEKKNYLVILVLSLLLTGPSQADIKKRQIQPSSSQSTQSSTITVKPTNTIMKPAMKQPDIMVDSFALTPGVTQNASWVNYQLVVKNTGGNSPVKTMLVSFTVLQNGNGRNDNFAVPGAGQSRTFSGQLHVPVDVCLGCTYKVILDVHNQVAESNENNNTATRTVGVQGRADVGFCLRESVCNELFINGGTNNDIYIGGEVYNYGCGVSPACTLDLNFPGQWPQTIQIPPIHHGQFFAFHVYMKWSSPGVRIGELILHPAQNDARTFNDRVKYKVNIVQ